VCNYGTGKVINDPRKKNEGFSLHDADIGLGGSKKNKFPETPWAGGAGGEEERGETEVGEIGGVGEVL
jgi:hypothetical protein